MCFEGDVLQDDYRFHAGLDQPEHGRYRFRPPCRGRPTAAKIRSGYRPYSAYVTAPAAQSSQNGATPTTTPKTRDKHLWQTWRHHEEHDAVVGDRHPIPDVPVPLEGEGKIYLDRPIVAEAGVGRAGHGEDLVGRPTGLIESV